MSKTNDIMSMLVTTAPTRAIPTEEPVFKIAEDVAPSMASLLNAQMNREVYSAFLYYAMGAHFGKLNLEGIESWFYKAAEEELKHSRKFNEYITDRNELAVFDAMQKPTFSAGSPTSIFEQVLTHEKDVTQNITNLFQSARAAGDVQTEEFLHWFLKEQVEEEKKVETILDQFKMFGDTGASLAIMDQKLGA